MGGTQGGGSGVGVGVVGPAGVVSQKQDQEGCALIGLGAEIGDIHRGCGICHWDVTGGFWMWIRAWRGEENPDSKSDG